ncbi:cytochrome P450, partial [Diaporthe sp. PMI_573]
VKPGEQVRGLWRSRDLVPSPSLRDALTSFFGMPERDLSVFAHDNISKFETSTTLSTSHPDPSRRIINHQRMDFATYFQGSHLRSTSQRFVENLCSETSHRVGPTKYLSPDLYDLLFPIIFHAEVRALYGDYIFKVCPTFCDDFFAFYQAFPALSIGLPAWLVPSRHKARAKMIENFKTWRAICKSLTDWRSLEVLEYEPIWGSRCIRRMVERHENMGFSDDGIASVMLGYLFVTIANSIPATIWMILNIFLDQNLAGRVESEIAAACSRSGEPDTDKLMRAPLLNSVYHETLRLRVAGTVGRRCPGSDFNLAGGRQIGRDELVVFANWDGGLDESFWNTGPLLSAMRPAYPVDSFWAERFLRYPDEPQSGPLRRPGVPALPNEPRTAENDRKAQLVTSGIQGHWFPFGGGSSRCPGETLAKNMMLCSVATVMRRIDIQLLDPVAAASVVSHHQVLPFGLHSFDKDVPVIVRHRH